MEMGVDWGATTEIWPSDVDPTARTYIQTTLKANQALGLTEDNDPNDLIGRPNGRECLKTNLQRAFARGPSTGTLGATRPRD
jgi:hypothetical protein